MSAQQQYRRDMAQQPSGKRRVLFAIKAAVSLALLGWVLHAALSREGVDVLRDRLASLSPLWIAVAIGLQFASVGAGVLRWRMLLRAQKIELPLAWLARSYLIGRFVGAFTPSTAGLDVYRGWAVARRTGETVRSASTIVVEKFVGLIGLSTVCLVLLGLGASDTLGTPALVASLAMAGGSCLGLWVLMSPSRARSLARVAPAKVRPRVANLLEALGAPGLSRSVLVGSVGLGICAHLAVSCVFVATGRALDLPVDFATLLVTGNVIVLATLMPISVGGVGVREGVAVLLLGAVAVGPTDATLVALLGYLTGQVPALIGGLLMLLPNGVAPPAVASGSAGSVT